MQAAVAPATRRAQRHREWNLTNQRKGGFTASRATRISAVGGRNLAHRIVVAPAARPSLPFAHSPMTSPPNLQYFHWAIAFTALGLALGALIGWAASGTMAGMLSILSICAILAVLEISLSFDNAVVNAHRLRTMSHAWQRRFLTWGIIIAVFGMRIVFPLVIVAVSANIGPVAAVRLAVVAPGEYARIMTEAHLGIAAFGGTFLMMVALSYFFDTKKEVHWVTVLEKRLQGAAHLRGIEIALVLILILGFSSILSERESSVFLHSAIWGLVTFLIVDVVRHMLDRAEAMLTAAARGGAGAFLYLEVLDASFSFDGVIGAFALSSNLFVIAIGLGIGAMYVRSMTIMLVEKGTLTQYRYLEHGAFYAIFVLAVMMYAQTLMHIPEFITGLGGAALIGIALISSIRFNRRQARRRR